MNWYDPQSKSLSPHAFSPTQKDTAGLSVSRAKYVTMEKASRVRPGKSYYIAVLRVGDLRAEGIEVTPDPLMASPGHALLPNMNYRRRKEKSNKFIEQRQALAKKLTLRVEGPFDHSAGSQGA